MKTLKLNIITPEKKFFQGDITKIITENINGQIGILPGHISMVTLMSPTITRFITNQGEEKKAFTSEGVLRVEKEKIDILCDSCEWPEDIDIIRAGKAEERARMRLSEKNENLDVKRAQMALKRALVRKGVTGV